MYGAFGFVKVQNPRGTGELRQIEKNDGKIPGNSEVNCRKRLHNFALFIRPKPGQLVLSRYINSLIRFCKTRGRGGDTGILWLPVT